ncbi:MAG: single-stranded DNA-binding protein, partial [Deltaproteobacteria bacterium]|nr:single-stranded DNA-binding protein [Deltaproteobacteria bacterium]MBW2533132.1 single-stranded DNA-binding protein [Deltaproteobacteria bacterium]
MSDGVNKVFLLGNIGADPELRTTSSGRAVLNFSIATNESWVDNDGIRRESTHWHRAVLWGKRAEALARVLRKGLKVMIEGALRTSSWDGPDGTKRTRTEVSVRELLFLPDGAGRDVRPPDEGRRTDRSSSFGTARPTSFGEP